MVDAYVGGDVVRGFAIRELPISRVVMAAEVDWLSQGRFLSLELH